MLQAGLAGGPWPAANSGACVNNARNEGPAWHHLHLDTAAGLVDWRSPAPVSQVASSGQSHQTAPQTHPDSCRPPPWPVSASRLTQSLHEPLLVNPQHPPPKHGSSPPGATHNWRTNQHLTSRSLLRSPWRLLPTTMRPSLSRMSLRSVVSASTAMISEATEMSKAVWRVMPFSLGPCKHTLPYACSV